MTRPPTPPPTPLLPQGLRFLNRRRRVLLRLAGWSLLEGGQTFLFGYALARALDDGFLAQRPGTGLAWLAAAAVAAVVGAYGTGRAYRAVAGLVEPLRDALVRRVVGRALGTADTGAVSRLTHQVEIARDTFAGVVTVARSFVFVAAGALVGLASLAPVLLLVVVPPLAAGLTLFLATLRPLARRQEKFLAADERVAAELGALVDGLRDITAAGAETWAERDAAEGIAAETRAAVAVARWGMLRVLALALAGWLPLLLLLLTAPWLLTHGATPGALAGAIGYVTQSLFPALTALLQGFGAAGARLAVVLRRLTAGTHPHAGDADAAGAAWGEDADVARAPGEEAAVPRGGDAGMPGAGVAPARGGEAAGRPGADAAGATWGEDATALEGDAVRAPGGEAASPPGGEAADTPGGETAPTPGGDAARPPGGEAASPPGGEAADTPGGETGPTPGGDAARSPGPGVAPPPAGGVARTPVAGGASKPLTRARSAPQDAPRACLL
ncbi:hypothetical protein G5C51_41630 [Streptomyces sp. A7024]|uniref:ABC transmembrane type-1 domain-containing protein n=1 Tax=Streptomyces coryli TaxID=1128680 RepID=A0A6G4UE75_9ACTN|nr:hypothetical protein [Streptomyces coryli]